MSAEGDRVSKLFEPLSLRGATTRNRVMVSPMCMYAAQDGHATDYHLVHLGRFALGGAGIVMAEGTAIDPVGRISHTDLGIWDDAHTASLTRVARFLEEYGAVPGIQLAHAGRKASARAAWAGGAPLTAEDAAGGEAPWPTVAPSPISPGPGWQEPAELSTAEVKESVRQWAAAARRAVEAGFRVVNLHGAHGYLLHSFLSPLANERTDRYGGSPEARMRYPLEVVRAVREAIGQETALFYRVSATDGVDGGLDVADTVTFARELGEAGVDLIDISSGGVVTDRSIDTRVRRGYAFHAGLSREVRDGSGMPVATVGLIVDPHQAEAVLAAGDADVVALGREMLANPQWAHHAQRTLLGTFDDWHREAGWAVAAQSAGIERLATAGETPMTRYGG